jgi:hypothetical protein
LPWTLASGGQFIADAEPPAAALSEPLLIEGELELALVLGLGEDCVLVEEDCSVDVPWVMVELELVSVDG